MFQTNIVEKI